MTLSQPALDAIRLHAAGTYPDECCGALLGRRDDAVIIEAFALPNASDEGPRKRFLVRPEDYRAAERHAAEKRAELIGFYHSHPDHPARPSQYDLDHAWPNLSYVIVSVPNGKPADVMSWRLRDDRTQFDPEPIVSSERATRPAGATEEAGK